ncbi:MAG TPA: SsrA-binding protein [Candidatus Woesebacteria bacterium]|nr:SsrA-binding protein [Candidatus Woesebacteria bacterium]
MKIENRIFHRNYQELETFEAGVVLSGGEVKSILNNGLKLEGSFVKIIDQEAILFSAEIMPYKFISQEDYNPVRKRKLLLHKKEIIKLQTKLQGAGKLTIIPIACYTKGRRIKFSIALAKARGEIGTKRLEKARDIKIDQEREIKEYMKK